MEFLKRVLPVIIAAVFAVSCASEESESYAEKELRSFERWMGMNVPDAIKLSTGLYYQWIDRADDDAEEPEWGDYIEINYRGLVLSDYDTETGRSSIFMTRYEEDAERLGTFTYYTHYVPQLIIYNRSNYLMEGMQAAMRLMKKGDNIRLFMGSAYATTTSSLTTSYGYQGNASLPGTPMIVEMELAGIVKHPQEKEEHFVNEFAEREWGQNLGDTIREYVYINMIEEGPDDKNIISADSTIQLFYAAFFAYDLKRETPEDADYDFLADPDKRLFLIETNIDTIATRYFRDISTTTTTGAVTYKGSSLPDSPTVATLGALYETFNTDEILYGSSFEMISTSSYAYGSQGQSPASGVTEVLPFQPIYFYVYVEEYPDEEDE